MSKGKIVLAYSGGLDTSVAIRWLQKEYDYDVVAVALDVGEGKDLDFIREKALKIGAVSSYVVDAKKEFADEYIAHALRANCLYEGVYPLVSALSRPLIAKKLVEIAKKENAVAVAHGCTGKGNDQVRFDVSFMALDPTLKIVAPVREAPKSREEAIEYAHQNDIPVPINLANPFSIDQNLWGRSCECGVLEDPWAAPPEEAYALTSSVENAPNTPEEITIEFEQGLPTKLNGKALAFENLIVELNQIAGKHGVGRIDWVENRLVGIKSREIYEAPAAMTLIKAHQALEGLCLPADVAHFKPIIEQKIAQTIYNGQWYSPIFEALNAFIKETQKTVNGEVRVKLFKGNSTVVGRRSANSLYKFELATYNPQDQFDHHAALGFIKLWGLPTQVFSMVNPKNTKQVEEKTKVMV